MSGEISLVLEDDADQIFCVSLVSILFQFPRKAMKILNTPTYLPYISGKNTRCRDN